MRCALNPMRDEAAKQLGLVIRCMASAGPLLCRGEEILQIPATSESAARSEAKAKRLCICIAHRLWRASGDDVLDSVRPVES